MATETTHRASFVVDSFGDEGTHSSVDDVNFSRARVEKTFSGDLVGTGTVEMLASRSPSGGAGYVALERIEGTLAGKTGTFALLHLGTMDGSGESGHWPIVPGSGTGELRGVSGTAKIERTEAGEHRMMLTCAWS